MLFVSGFVDADSTFRVLDSRPNLKSTSSTPFSSSPYFDISLSFTGCASCILAPINQQIFENSVAKFLDGNHSVHLMSVQTNHLTNLRGGVIYGLKEVNEVTLGLRIFAPIEMRSQTSNTLNVAMKNGIFDNFLWEKITDDTKDIFPVKSTNHNIAYSFILNIFTFLTHSLRF